MKSSALTIRTLIQYLFLLLSTGTTTLAQLDSTGGTDGALAPSDHLGSRAARPDLAIKWCNAKEGTPNQNCKEAKIPESLCTGHDCSIVDSMQYWNSFFVTNNEGYNVSLYTAEESSHCGKSNYLVADNISYGHPVGDVSVHLLNTKWKTERPKYFAVMCTTTRKKWWEP